MTDQSKFIMESIREGSDPESVIDEALTRTRGGMVNVPDEISEWKFQKRPPARIKHADTRFMKCRALWVLEDDHPSIAVARIDKNEYRGYSVKVGVYDDKGEPQIFDEFSQQHESVENATAQLMNLLPRYSSVQDYIDDSTETKTAFDRSRKDIKG